MITTNWHGYRYVELVVLHEIINNAHLELLNSRYCQPSECETCVVRTLCKDLASQRDYLLKLINTIDPLDPRLSKS